MKKVVRDGKVAILISRNYGLGWYTWNSEFEELLFHPKLVEMVEQDRRDEITEDLVKKILGLNESIRIYTDSAKNLAIQWLPVGTPFYVNNYDGSESILTPSHLTLTA